MYLPVTFVNHAATLREAYCFKYFLAFSNASNSWGMGINNSLDSSENLYPKGGLTNVTVTGMGTYSPVAAASFG